MMSGVGRGRGTLMTELLMQTSPGTSPKSVPSEIAKVNEPEPLPSALSGSSDISVTVTQSSRSVSHTATAGTGLRQPKTGTGRGLMTPGQFTKKASKPSPRQGAPPKTVTANQIQWENVSGDNSSCPEKEEVPSYIKLNDVQLEALNYIKKYIPEGLENEKPPKKSTSVSRSAVPKQKKTDSGFGFKRPQPPTPTKQEREEADLDWHKFKFQRQITKIISKLKDESLEEVLDDLEKQLQDTSLSDKYPQLSEAKSILEVLLNKSVESDDFLSFAPLLIRGVADRSLPEFEVIFPALVKEKRHETIKVSGSDNVLSKLAERFCQLLAMLYTLPVQRESKLHEVFLTCLEECIEEWTYPDGIGGYDGYQKILRPLSRRLLFCMLHPRESCMGSLAQDEVEGFHANLAETHAHAVKSVLKHIAVKTVDENTEAFIANEMPRLVVLARESVLNEYLPRYIREVYLDLLIFDGAKWAQKCDKSFEIQMSGQEADTEKQSGIEGQSGTDVLAIEEGRWDEKGDMNYEIELFEQEPDNEKQSDVESESWTEHENGLKFRGDAQFQSEAEERHGVEEPNYGMLQSVYGPPEIPRVPLEENTCEELEDALDKFHESEDEYAEAGAEAECVTTVAEEKYVATAPDVDVEEEYVITEPDVVVEDEYQEDVKESSNSVPPESADINSAETEIKLGSHDPYNEIRAMLEELGLEQEMPRFKQNLIRDPVLAAEEGKLKSVLQEAGFPIGLIFEIQSYVASKDASKFNAILRSKKNQELATPSQFTSFSDVYKQVETGKGQGDESGRKGSDSVAPERPSNTELGHRADSPNFKDIVKMERRYSSESSQKASDFSSKDGITPERRLSFGNEKNTSFVVKNIFKASVDSVFGDPESKKCDISSEEKWGTEHSPINHRGTENPVVLKAPGTFGVTYHDSPEWPGLPGSMAGHSQNAQNKKKLLGIGRGNFQPRGGASLQGTDRNQRTQPYTKQQKTKSSYAGSDSSSFSIPGGTSESPNWRIRNDDNDQQARGIKDRDTGPWNLSLQDRNQRVHNRQARFKKSPEKGGRASKDDPVRNLFGNLGDPSSEKPVVEKPTAAFGLRPPGCFRCGKKDHMSHECTDTGALFFND